ncbi:MAG: hypothetical protein HYS61_05600 [Acidobacteria bacterium]|nr:hypothetical protein [Acidobacteriota bacterium]
MLETVDDVYCRNCSELLFRILRREDGSAVMKDPSLEPASDGLHKYFLCPTCRGKNLAMLIEDPPGSRYYEIAGFIRS